MVYKKRQATWLGECKTLAHPGLPHLPGLFSGHAGTTGKIQPEDVEILWLIEQT